MAIAFVTKGIDFDVDLTKKYLGTVEDIDDPLRIGRARVRVEWLFGTKDDIPTEDLPWANQKHSTNFGMAGQCGSISIPKLGAIVEIEFNDNNIYAPEFHLMQELAQDVKDELQKEYAGTSIIEFDGDEDLKIYYTLTKGLTFYLKGSRINFGVDKTITIEHDGTTSIIELVDGTIRATSDSQIELTAGTRIKQTAAEVWVDGKTTKVGHSPQYSAVLGETLFSLFTQLAGQLDAKWPPSPGVATAAVETMKKLILSDTVKVSK